jgi:hypothetical protein
MDQNNNQLKEQENQNLKAGILARGLQFLLMFSVMGLELFFGSGNISWIWAWVFLGIGLLSVSINSFFMLRSSPETVAERGRPKETQAWDKWVSGVWLLGQYFALPLVAALDNRFRWTGEQSLVWHVVSAIAYSLSLGLSSWAMISNAFFSTAVRLQADRG